MKNIESLVKNQTCTGCGICFSVCPYGNIELIDGDLGFPVPHIKECNECGVCIKNCPFSNEFDENDG